MPPVGRERKYCCIKFNGIDWSPTFLLILQFFIHLALLLLIDRVWCFIFFVLSFFFFLLVLISSSLLIFHLILQVSKLILVLHPCILFPTLPYFMLIGFSYHHAWLYGDGTKAWKSTHWRHSPWILPRRTGFILPRPSPCVRAWARLNDTRRGINDITSSIIHVKFFEQEDFQANGITWPWGILHNSTRPTLDNVYVYIVIQNR